MRTNKSDFINALVMDKSHKKAAVGIIQKNSGS